tara:strand:+ start:620 stop:1147 length:528 start_codon:yes stop_codon:yes gene_type:complete
MSTLKVGAIQSTTGNAAMTVANTGVATFASPPQGTGKILQVKQSVFPHASGMSSTNTSMVTTGHTITITPSSASSKISLFNTSTLYNGSGHNVKVTITKNHSGISETDLASAADQGFTQLHTPSSAIGSGSAIVFLDSPSTTNEITYTVKIKVSGGTGFYPIGGDAVLIAMEVAQ